jgi:hypothetical protein
MSQPINNKTDSMSATVGLATQMANTMLVCLRETYLYLVPKAKAEGIEIDAQSAHALAVSLWIQLARERAGCGCRRLGSKGKTTNHPESRSGPKPNCSRVPSQQPFLEKLRGRSLTRAYRRPCANCVSCSSATRSMRRRFCVSCTKPLRVAPRRLQAWIKRLSGRWVCSWIAGK